MKKFALSLLSIFMILGGMILTACDKEISLSVSTEEVSLYTNDERQESEQEITVKIENSKFGIETEIVEGKDVITVGETIKKSDNTYSFKISTYKESKNSNSKPAIVRVRSIEDEKIFKEISVNVYTVVNELIKKDDNNVDGKTNLFVVKGKTKMLNWKDYFTVRPVTANILDFDWFIITNEGDVKEFVVDGTTIASIAGNNLFVDPEYAKNKISLKAVYKYNNRIFNQVDFEVLEDSTIDTFILGDTTFYEGSELKKDFEIFQLSRNGNESDAKVEGIFIANSKYKVVFDALVYTIVNGEKTYLQGTEYKKYFTFNIDSAVSSEGQNKTKYNFHIDAFDSDGVFKFGEYYFVLKLSYENYNYDIITDNLKILISTSYSATKLDIEDKDGNNISEGKINVFSSYEDSFGFEINTVLTPSEVALNNNMFYIEFDLNEHLDKEISVEQNVLTFAKFYYQNELLTFTRENSSVGLFRSKNLVSGSKLYVLSQDVETSYENMKFNFVYAGNPGAVKTSIEMNFYKISQDKNLDVKKQDDTDVDALTYIAAERGNEIFFDLKINEISISSGLTLKYDDNYNYEFSSLSYVPHDIVKGEVPYLNVKFSVKLRNSNAKDKVSFWFEHITGKISQKFVIESFIPLNTVTIENGDKSSSNIFNYSEIGQSYYLDAGNVLKGKFNDTSMSRIMMEASSTVPLDFKFGNANLSEQGIIFKFLSFKDIKAIIHIQDPTLSDEDVENRAETLFNEESLDLISTSDYYRRFSTAIDGLLFDINTKSINLNDSQFKGYICVEVNGYNSLHEDKTIVRFFALESFYSVRYLYANHKNVSLYTRETLSFLEENKSVKNIQIALRPDQKIPTYTNNLEFFEISSAVSPLEKNGNNLKNLYYEISDIGFSLEGRAFSFNITAYSTNAQTLVKDILSIKYKDSTGKFKETEIQIEIKNVDRVEELKWINKNIRNEIYFNLASSLGVGQNYAISTYIAPKYASDIGISYIYAAKYGNPNNLVISSNEYGDVFNLNLRTNEGGFGNLYFLPNDMIKTKDGIKHVLVYNYEESLDGGIVENPIYIKLSELDSYYEDIINGNNGISNYFYNNNREKIYYKDIIVKISIVIADGSSENTAIRIYSEKDMLAEKIDYSKYYRVMNNIDLHNWKTIGRFNGVFFADKPGIVLNFCEDPDTKETSDTFINILEQNGSIKDLIFSGIVKNSEFYNEHAGFVVNENFGTIDGVSIDVYYEGKNYFSSMLKASTTKSAGLIVGNNEGIIKNSYVYGGSIFAGNTSYTGGIAGINSGKILSSGIEFYLFKNVASSTSLSSGEKASTNSYSNLRTEGILGGLVGLGQSGSIVEKSYVFAYPLIEDPDFKNVLNSINDSKEAPVKTSAFIGQSRNNVTVNQSLAFVGDLQAPIHSEDTASFTTFKDSYITYKTETDGNPGVYIDHTQVFVDDKFYYNSDGYSMSSEYENLNSSDIPLNYDNPSADKNKWNELIKRLDSNIWEFGVGINKEINFGFMHLKNTVQSAPVEISTLSVVNNTNPLKSLNADNNKGILFVYDTEEVINSGTMEKVELDFYNTISISELFGITEKQARSIILESESNDVVIGTNSIKVLRKNIESFDISICLKMDFTVSKKIKFIILNQLPELTATINSVELKDTQTILLQNKTTKDILYTMQDDIYLNNKKYIVKTEDFTIGYEIESADVNFVSVDDSRKSRIAILGKKAHDVGTVSSINTFVKIKSVQYDEDFSKAIKVNRNKLLNISVYDGATTLVVENASSLVVSPSQFAKFDVKMITDLASDNLAIYMENDGMVVEPVRNDDIQSLSFKIDEDLILDVTWTKTFDIGVYNYSVLVKINDSIKHKVVKDYNKLTLIINAKSQDEVKNDSLSSRISISVKPQEVEDIRINAYNVENRIVENSIFYYQISEDMTNTAIPASDFILSVGINPAYSRMTHFDMTYSVLGSGNVGSVILQRLKYSPVYGYYVSNGATLDITNGIRTIFTEEDKKGNGIFYFRIYVSSEFKTNSTIRFSVTPYNDTKALKTATHNININYMREANIKVNGASTYILAKGSSAEVTVTVGLNQNLHSLYLQNHEENIRLSQYTVQILNDRKVYTATLSAGVNAKLVGGAKSGIFYVCATIERVINNIQEMKVARATLCLVDFTIDGKGIKINNSGAKKKYKGGMYDVYTSYVNASGNLIFNYPVIPDKYIYDESNADELAAVNKIEASKNKFALNNNYKDEKAEYYINYDFNRDNGMFTPLTLKEQLWYASSVENSNAIYNKNSGRFSTNPYFDIKEREYNNGDKFIEIIGKRTGEQLMRLKTKVYYQGIEFVYDYYFLISVEIWSDEDAPVQIDSAEKFIKLMDENSYGTDSSGKKDFILMNDIVLDNYSPISTNVDSFDGNGFTIYLNSFNMPGGNSLDLALFDKVAKNTTLKNVKLNIYKGGQIKVDISQYNAVNIAGFALVNDGIIYNSEVVSFYNSTYHKSSIVGDTGLVVKYTNGKNTDPINLTNAMGIESSVSGFVNVNNASVVNCRVGGEVYQHIITSDNINYIKEERLDTFVIEGQGDVSGFVNTNFNTGNISASFVDNVQIYNKMESIYSKTAGFVLNNHNKIQDSYVEGVNKDNKIHNDASNITSQGVIAGFVYYNNALIKNSYSNIALINSETTPYMAAGFVYENANYGVVTLCYTACSISKFDIDQMYFSGVDSFAQSLNRGKITLSYFYNPSRINDTNQNKLTTGALSVTEIIDNESEFYGFSFASDQYSYDGIWKSVSNGVSLVSANRISLSNRYAVVGTNNITSLFYNDSILNVDTLEVENLTYGGINNPIIIRSASDFAKATGKATEKEVSSYKRYYDDENVFGNYRIVNDVNFSTIDQNADGENKFVLTTTKKTFRGLLDGNGFTISSINLGSYDICENYGLFAKLENAVVMNLDFVVRSIHNTEANIVGTLAGTALNSKILAISLQPDKIESSISRSYTSIQGNNIVGGVVGILLGDSKLNDITVTDIDVSSSHFSEGKEMLANRKFTGENLRDDVNINIPLRNKVSQLSYAGGVAGYIDIYNSLNNIRVAYREDLKSSDSNVSTIKALDSVNIYAEISGGLFGYVGKSTFIYDAKLELNAGQNRESPSYIISKNLFAGGLIGENYGGLYAVSAVYENDLQLEIESNENKYYNGDLTVERGQDTIFCYDESDDDFGANKNDPMFIGGLVGYMGGGYINVGMSKLNVISSAPNTVSIGGVVGIAGYGNDSYPLYMLNGKPKVNFILNEVYSSGDVYTKNAGVSAGIIGSIEKNNGVNPILALKKVLAVNYYSFEEGYVNGINHYRLFGRIYESESSLEENIINDTPIYIIDTDDGYVDIVSGTTLGNTGADTVGGYSIVKDKKFKYDGNLESEAIKDFGFDIKNKNLSIIDVKSISENSMNSNTSAYISMYNYFIGNGWNEVYWNHSKDELLPHIELFPKLDIIFWDYYNTEMVLEAMKDSSVTVIVRGKSTELDNDYNYQDINLTIEEWNSVSGFTGKIYSYYEYMKDEQQGKITRLTKNSEGKTIGGNKGGNVGIILNKSLFTSLEGAFIEGVSFYFNNEDVGTSNYSLVADELKRSIFRNCKFVLNNNKYINTKHVGGIIGFAGASTTVSAAGLISAVSEATSFVGIQIEFRNDAELKFIHASNDEDPLYVGAISGYMVQNSTTTSVAVEDIRIYNKDYVESKNIDDKVNINVQINEHVEEFNFGVYAGGLVKEMSGRLTLGMAQMSNVEININETGDCLFDRQFNIGGYVGVIEKASKVYILGDTNIDISNEIFIYLNAKISDLKAGLMFGKMLDIEPINNLNKKKVFYKGGIYQREKGIVDNANIGGLIGYANSIVRLKNVFLDFELRNVVEEEGKTAAEKEEYLNIYKTAHSLNLNEYALNPFRISQNTGVNNSIGGILGYSDGGDFELLGQCIIEGIVDVIVGPKVEDAPVESATTVESKYISVGGVLGKASGNIRILSNIRNDINILLSSEKDVDLIAYVGGVIGQVYLPSDSIQHKIAINKECDDSLEFGIVSYGGDVLFNASTLKFGGAIGYIGEVNNQEDPIINISGFTFSGSVKIYGESISGGNIVVGGVLGEYKCGASFKSANNTRIANNFTSGDIFVNYSYKKNNEELNYKLESYIFGGIVGVAAKDMRIFKNYSMLTSFNNKLTNHVETASKVYYRVGAIVGTNSTSVIFDDAESNSTEQKTTEENPNLNYYASGVNLAYQEESDAQVGSNIDLPYQVSSNYVGYSNSKNVNSVNNSILSMVSKFFTNVEYQFGEKLKPYIWSDAQGGSKINIVSVDEMKNPAPEGKVNICGKTHNITWISLDRDLVGSASSKEAISDDFKNIAFIGNGKTFRRSVDLEHGYKEKEPTENKNFGGLVNSMGGFDEIEVNFNVISSLILDAAIHTDLKRNNDTVLSAGGITGTMDGNSFIYGVGVTGSFSVGALKKDSASIIGTDLDLGGIVGNMTNGMIDNCFVDADIIYRGNDIGNVAGIANIGFGNNTIKATYNSGTIETFERKDIYTFVNKKSNKDKQDYGKLSIIVEKSFNLGTNKGNVKILDKDGNEVTTSSQIVLGETYKLQAEANEGYSFKGWITSFGQSINPDSQIDVEITEEGCTAEAIFENENIENQITNEIVDCYSIARIKQNNNEGVVRFSNDENNIICRNVVENDSNLVSIFYGDKDLANRYKNLNFNGAETTNDNWYFSPYVNYGYASHGFGYMRNVSIYKKNQIKIGDSSENYKYSFEKLYIEDVNINQLEDGTISGPYDRLNVDASGTEEELYLAVPNIKKFEEMAEISNENETVKYNFVIVNDLVINSIYRRGSENEIIENLGSEKFTTMKIDGGYNTLDMWGTETSQKTRSTAIFKKIWASISNLNIKNVKIENNPGTVINNTTITNKEFAASGVLADQMLGNLNNVTVTGSNIFSPEQKPEKTTLIGGVVGYFIGTIDNVDAVVNVNVSRNNTITGGIIGFLDSDTSKVSYSTNNGQITNSATEAGDLINAGINVKSYRNKSLDEVNVSQDKSVNSIVGGLVGLSIGGEISKSYNLNSVLNNYSEEIGEINAVSGGIAGYVKDTNFKNCYNAGFVGTGNNANEEFLYSGGIFGYAYYTENSIKIENCINEGLVQAVGKQSGLYKIEKGEPSTSEETTEFSNHIDNLTYDLTLTYNQELDRKVYAAGLGFAILDTNFTELKIVDENSYSLNHTVSNKGNIGEVKQTETLVVDRRKALDNDYNYESNKATNIISKNTFAKFKIKKDDDTSSKLELKANFYDVYGIPYNFSVIDTITRRYSNEDQTSKINGEIKDKLKEWGEKVGLGDFWDWSLFDLFGYSGSNIPTENNSIKGGKGEYGNTEGYDDYKSNFEEFKNNPSNGDDFLEASSEYPSYCRFVEYSKFVESYNKSSILVLGKQDNAGETEPIWQVKGSEVQDKSELNSEVSLIEQEKEEKCKKDLYYKDILPTTVNGVDTAIIYSGDGMSAVYAPYEYTTEVTFDLSDHDDKFNISEQNFIISVEKDGEIVKPQFYKVILPTTVVDYSNYNVKVKMSFANDMNDATVTVSMFHMKGGNVTLGQKNLFKYDGKHYLIFADDSGSKIDLETWNKIDDGTYKFVEAESSPIFKGCDNYNIEYYSTTSNSTINDGLKAIFEDVGLSEFAYIKLENVPQNLSPSVEFKFKEIVSKDIKKDIIFNNGQNIILRNIEYELKDFKQELKDEAANIFEISNCKISNMREFNPSSLASGSVNLNEFFKKEKTESDLIVFGDSEYIVLYENGVWNIKKQPASQTPATITTTESGDAIFNFGSDIDREIFLNFKAYQKLKEILPVTNDHILIKNEKIMNGKVEVVYRYKLELNNNDFELFKESETQSTLRFKGNDFENIANTSDGTITKVVDYQYLGVEFTKYEIKPNVVNDRNEIKLEYDSNTGVEILGKNGTEIVQYNVDEINSSGNKLIVLKNEVNNFIINKYSTQRLPEEFNYKITSTDKISSEDNSDSSQEESENGRFYKIQIKDTRKKFKYGIKEEKVNIVYNIYKCNDTNIIDEFSKAFTTLSMSWGYDKYMFKADLILYKNGAKEEEGKTYISKQTFKKYKVEENEKGETVQNVIVHKERVIDSNLNCYDYDRIKGTQENAYPIPNTQYIYKSIDTVHNFDFEIVVLDFNPLNTKTLVVINPLNINNIIVNEKDKEAIYVKGSEKVDEDRILGFSSDIYDHNVVYDYDNLIKDAINPNYDIKGQNTERHDFEYCIKYDSKWKVAQDGKIKAETFKQQEYVYKYKEDKHSTPVTLATEEGQSIEYYYNKVFIKNNVYLNMRTFKENDKIIEGNNHFIRYLNNGEQSLSLFENNGANISNLNVVSVIDSTNVVPDVSSGSAETKAGTDSVKKYGAFITNNSGNISNINVYGSIRNINGDETVAVYPFIVNSEIDVSSSTTEGGPTEESLISAHISNNKSYLNITGRDSIIDKNIVAKIIDDVTLKTATKNLQATNYESFSVIIGGNGKHGDNGQNATGETKDDLAGEDGVDGFKPGEIKISKFTFKGLVNAGVIGVAGNGGNGAHGYYVAGSVLGGGKSGKAGNQDLTGLKDDRTLLETGVTDADKDISFKNISFNVYREKKSVSGNVGVGGLGRIYYQESGGNVLENEYYASASNGNAETNGKSMSSRVWVTSNKNKLVFGHVKDLKFFEYTDHASDLQIWEGTPHRISANCDSYIKQDIDSENNVKIQDVNSRKVSKFYVFSAVFGRRALFDGFMTTFNVEDYLQLAWSSGETINGQETITVEGDIVSF